jgi:phage gp29-like protein
MIDATRPPNGYSPQELGFPGPPAPPPGDLPPGGGGASVPSFLQFAALIQSGARTYRYTFDEALRNNPANARAMWRDAVIWKTVRARQMPTAALSWHIDPRDETNPAEQEAAKIVTAIVERIPNFQRFRMCLLDAIWFGRSGVEMLFKWDQVYGRTCLTLRDFNPVNGDSLKFRHTGEVGVLVHSSFPGTWEPTDWGMAHFLTPAEREQFVVHRHEPEAADWLEGDLAGAINGVGLRGRLYWCWWMKQQVFALLMNYLERFANGLTIFYYDAHNPQAKAEAERAAREQYSNNALLYPRWAEGKDTNGVQRLEAGTASPALLQSLVTEYFDAIIKETIIGQTLTSDTAATGLGSGVADLHGMTLARIIKYDATNLDATIQADLIDLLYRWNCPGVPPGRYSSEVDTPNAKEVLGYAETMFDMGVALDEGQLYKISQLQKPKPGGGIVSKLGGMQPAAVGGEPQGVPVAGEAGPPGDPSQQAQQPAESQQPQQPAEQSPATEPVRTVRQSRAAARVDVRGLRRQLKAAYARRDGAAASRVVK